jgi:hypothetical protein
MNRGLQSGRAPTELALYIATARLSPNPLNRPDGPAKAWMNLHLFKPWFVPSLVRINGLASPFAAKYEITYESNLIEHL